MRTLFSTLITAISATASLAQPTVDITLANNGNGQLEVRLRPDGPFNGVVSSISFTLHWNETFGPALELLEPSYPVYEYIPVAPSALVSDGNGTLYRTITAFGTVLMSDFGQAWTAGNEYTICTFDILEPDVEVSIENNAYTTANNRDYFLSLNGEARTGAPFESAIPAVSALAQATGTGSVDVVLTPDAAFFGWVSSVNLTLRWPANGATLGQLVQSPEMAATIPMEKVGAETMNGGFVHQRFHGEGLGSLAHLATGWAAAPQTLFSIAANGNLQIVDVAADAYTASIDGSYAVLLNSEPRAGTTDDQTIGLDEASAPGAQLIVTPDHLIVSTPNPGKAELRITSSNGALVARYTVNSAGTGNERIAIGALGSGVYTATLLTGSGAISKRFIR